MNEVARMHAAPKVALRPNLRKILEAIAFIIAEGERRRAPVTQYDILKTLFLADKAHLNRFGRPITFDNYWATRDGPVPSLAYDMLKETPSVLRHHGLQTLPWKRSGPEHGSGRCYYSGAKPDYDEDVLSVSDVQALSDALVSVKAMTFVQMRRLTHADQAYVEAWKDDGKRRYMMSYGMLFDSPDFEMALHVKEMSELT